MHSILDRTEDDDKLIATHAKTNIVVAHGAGHSGSGLFEHDIAALMTPGVVDDFKSIQIDEEESENLVPGLASSITCCDIRGKLSR